MDNSSSEVVTLETPAPDYSISSLLGLSMGIVVTIFTIFLIGLQIANIHVLELLRGDFHIHGDPSILYMGIFLISATILLVVQHNLAKKIEEERNNEF